VTISVLIPFIFSFLDTTKDEINPPINKQKIFCPTVKTATLCKYITITPIMTGGAAIISGIKFNNLTFFITNSLITVHLTTVAP
jgi:hypothetical protein